jgi:hypothetical protein
VAARGAAAASFFDFRRTGRRRGGFGFADIASLRLLHILEKQTKAKNEQESRPTKQNSSQEAFDWKKFNTEHDEYISQGQL